MEPETAWVPKRARERPVPSSVRLSQREEAKNKERGQFSQKLAS